MWRLFRPRKYRGQNKRHGFLKEYKEGEEIKIVEFPPLSLCLCVSSEAGGESFYATGFCYAKHWDAR